MSKSSFLRTVTARRTILAFALAAVIPPVTAFAQSGAGSDGDAMAKMGMYMNGKVQAPPTPATTGNRAPDGAAMARMGMYVNGSARVRSIQAALNHKAHADLALDGGMDAQTQAALKKFQLAHGLKPTGRITKPTAKALGLN
ncbi:MAG: peptidoglycan-binding domain-containing protein [Acidiferrobacter sp.]